MSDDIIPLLKVHEYFRDVRDEALQEIVRHARVIQHAAGSVVHEADVVLTTVNFVLRGRLIGLQRGGQGGGRVFRPGLHGGPLDHVLDVGHGVLDQHGHEQAE